MIISLHVPKTGGRSFSLVLERVYGRDFYRCSTSTHVAQLPDTAKCIHGHLPFGVNGQLPKRHKSNVHYVATLREPVERIKSMHRFVESLVNKGHRDWLAVGAKGKMSIEEFVRLPICSLDNGMVRQFSGMPFGEENVSRLVNEDDYNRALRNIKDRFVVVGLLEKFDDYVLACAEMFKWPSVPEIAVKNRSKIKKSRTGAGLIRERNVWDIMLYKHLKDKE